MTIDEVLARLSAGMDGDFDRAEAALAEALDFLGLPVRGEYDDADVAAIGLAVTHAGVRRLRRAPGEGAQAVAELGEALIAAVTAEA